MAQALQSQATQDQPKFLPMPELALLAGMTPEQRTQFQRSAASRFHSALQLFDASDDDAAWPTRTDERCRWCMHTFDWFPVGIPTRYDELRRKMVLSGFFCSFACALSYVEERPKSCYAENAAWLWRLARHGFGVERINRAPPREMLNRMTIEEFRAASATHVYEAIEISRRSHALLFEREQEVVVSRRLVDRDVELSQVREREEAEHAENALQGLAKRRRKATAITTTAEAAAVAAEANANENPPPSVSFPALMPAQWVRAMRAHEEKQPGKAGIMNMLGAKLKN